MKKSKKNQKVKKSVVKFLKRPLFILSISILFIFATIEYQIIALSSKVSVDEKLAMIEPPKLPNDFLQSSLNLNDVKKANFDTTSKLIDEKSLGSKEDISFKQVSFNVNNLREYAVVSLPNSAVPEEGYPVIILLHGFVPPTKYKSTGNYYYPDMIYYSKNGFAVIRPDLRGHGVSEGVAEGAYYSMAYNTDIMYLIGAIKNSSSFNSQNINFWGHSMGAYLALRASVIKPGVKNAILLAGPVGDLPQIFNLYIPPSDTQNQVAGKIKNRMISKFGAPDNEVPYWKSSSPLNHLANSGTYFQIHVGAKDKVVPPQLSSDLDAQLKIIGKPHQYFLYPTGDHGLLRQRPSILENSLTLLKLKN